MNSALYMGVVRHRRHEPVEHAFRYRMYQLYLDLDELPDVFDQFWLWSARRPALAWFRRNDHFGDPQRDLVDCVRDQVESATGRRPSGPIRMLTNLRYFGYAINPVSYFYCFDALGRKLETVLAEVHNTPWGERHCYVIDRPVKEDSNAPQTRWTDKDFHVSPFMQMQMRYRWRLNCPGEHLAVSLQNHVRDEDVDVTEQQTARKDAATSSCAFDVTMHLRRRELNSRNLRRALLRFPFMTGKVAMAIYWQALRLHLKGVPFVPHPRKSQSQPTGRAHASIQPEGSNPQLPQHQ